MSAFVWTIAVLGGIEVLSSLMCMARGIFPKRTMGSVAFNTAAWAGVVGWAIYLIGVAS